MEAPEFKSALDFCEVRDFAYPDFHPLHYGVPLSEMQGTQDNSSGDLDNDGNTFSDDELRQVDMPVSEDPVVYYSPDDIYRRAVALFDFVPENDNEIELIEGQVVWISYRHGQGWLVAENLESGATGLVPEEYVQLMPGEEDEWVDDAEGEDAASKAESHNSDEVKLQEPVNASQAEPHAVDLPTDKLEKLTLSG